MAAPQVEPQDGGWRVASADSMEHKAASAARSPAMMKVAAVGLVTLGVVHVLIGVLALSIAWGNGGEEASASGAFVTIAEQPFGKAALWVCAIGLVGLAIWQISEAIWGHRDSEGLPLLGKRVGSGGKAVAYLFLAVIAARTAMGDLSGSGDSEQGFTAKLMGVPAGQFLVGAIGVTFVGIAIYLAHRGATKAFTKHLDGHSGSTIVRLGQVGHFAKAVAYAIIGVLFVTAAVQHDPEESGGLDEALTTLRDQPYGAWLLTIVAVGLMAYGIYAFAWARAMQAKS
jgi:hypothetical protein